MLRVFWVGGIGKVVYISFFLREASESVSSLGFGFDYYPAPSKFTKRFLSKKFFFRPFC